MDKNYTKYTAEELLNDDYFLDSELYPTEKDQRYWLQIQQQDDSVAREIETARFCLKKIREIQETESLPIQEQEALWRRIQQENNRHAMRKKHFLFVKKTISIVASLVFLLASGWYFWYNRQLPVDYAAMLQSMPQTGDPSDNVQLILSNAEQKIMIEGKEPRIEYDRTGEVSIYSDSVAMKQKSEKSKKEAYNHLIVPKGKRSFLTFADGSKLWVNAGSIVIYPEEFAGGKREIFVDGEVFLDIVHDEKRPFVVKTHDMEIWDLGTQFDVSSYENASGRYVVLVKGEVEIRMQGKDKKRLIPDQMFVYDQANGKNTIRSVNTQDYTAWKDGYYQFNHQKLNVVLEKLSQYYGIEILVNEKAGNLTCSGKLDLKEELGKVLGVLQALTPIEIEQTSEHIKVIVK